MNNTHMVSVVRNEHDLDESFIWAMMKVVDRVKGLYLIQVGQRKMLTKGPRKGTEVFKPPYFKSYVTEFQGMLEQIAYETRTGKCGECLGESKLFIGWSRDSGNKFGPCRSCNSTGVATTPDTQKEGEE